MHNSYLQDGSIFNLVECWATQNPWEEKCPKNIGHIYHHFSLLLIDRQTSYGLKCFSCRKNNCLETTPAKEKKCLAPCFPPSVCSACSGMAPRQARGGRGEAAHGRGEVQVDGGGPRPPPQWCLLGWGSLPRQGRHLLGFAGL